MEFNNEAEKTKFGVSMKSGLEGRNNFLTLRVAIKEK